MNHLPPQKFLPKKDDKRTRIPQQVQRVETHSPTEAAKMAEMKKSSYYVLFLGAKESKGLRGPHYVEPVLQYFVSQESRMQALKVTLQVSVKGLKIIPCNQRVVGVNSASENNSHSEKHFIPHHAITCVFQAPPPNDDIVSCILLIYNPDTKCPVHVHCYRCDSPETAAVLKEQLEQLVNREENQKKFRDIETRLQSKGLLPCHSSKGRDRGTPEFDCRTSDSSENSDRGFGSGSGSSNLTSDRIATLYDSLAAELREKLSARKRNTPLLFPPRDYDTIHRQRGNLMGIDNRRCSNPAVVGATGNRRSYASREQESCGRSSGIGSTEDNCSPIHDALMENNVGPSSSEAEEDWNPSHLVATESTQFLVRPVWPPTADPHHHHHSSHHRSQPSSQQQHHHQVATHAPSPASPVPPPLPKRPELRQRSPDLSSPPPPVPVFSRERFEGVRQKWEKLDHQYVRQRSHDSLDEGYRSREAAEADYRRQLSRESLLRSLSRSKTGSRDSLDRWVENGMRSRGMWRPVDDEHHHHPPVSHSKSGAVGGTLGLHPSRGEQHSRGDRNGYPSPHMGSSGNPRRIGHPVMPMMECGSRIPVKNSGGCNIPNCGSNPRSDPRRTKDLLSYRELDEQERFPGLDKDTARTTLHNSSLNLSQHIYSEPSFDHIPSSAIPPAKNGQSPAKGKKFSFTFWK